MNADYRAAQAELAESNSRLQGFAGWMSPEDHEAAVNTAVEQSNRTGHLAAKLAGAGVAVDSREFRFLSAEFEGVAADEWDDKLTELRETSPAFFGPGGGGPPTPPRSNPEDRTPADITDAGRAVSAAAIRAAVADGTYNDPKVRRDLLIAAGHAVP
jgi:hypothetical protein